MREGVFGDSLLSSLSLLSRSLFPVFFLGLWFVVFHLGFGFGLRYRIQEHSVSLFLIFYRKWEGGFLNMEDLQSSSPGAAWEAQFPAKTKNKTLADKTTSHKTANKWIEIPKPKSQSPLNPKPEKEGKHQPRRYLSFAVLLK